MIKTSIHCENCGNIGEYGFTEKGSIEEVYESYYGGRCPKMWRASWWCLY